MRSAVLTTEPRHEEAVRILKVRVERRAVITVAYAQVLTHLRRVHFRQRRPLERSALGARQKLVDDVLVLRAVEGARRVHEVAARRNVRRRLCDHLPLRGAVRREPRGVKAPAVVGAPPHAAQPAARRVDKDHLCLQLGLQRVHTRRHTPGQPAPLAAVRQLAHRLLADVRRHHPVRRVVCRRKLQRLPAQTAAVVEDQGGLRGVVARRLPLGGRLADGEGAADDLTADVLHLHNTLLPHARPLDVRLARLRAARDAQATREQGVLRDSDAVVAQRRNHVVHALDAAGAEHVSVHPQEHVRRRVQQRQVRLNLGGPARNFDGDDSTWSTSHAGTLCLHASPPSLSQTCTGASVFSALLSS
eukprot:Rhum_TRINITY_DN13731_c0_g1::Rhum_TRINITY_DN13731_c0_g1_i1::g.63438::m.63438